MDDKTKKTPQERGIRTFFGKRYIWLINPDGKLELHSLERPLKED